MDKICVGIYKKPSSSKKFHENVKGVVVPPRNVPKLGIRGVHDISKTIYHRSMKFCTLVEYVVITHLD